MKPSCLLIIVCIVSLSVSEKKTTKKAPDPLRGTWCTESDGMVLTFSPPDTLFVTSKSDATIQGAGTYVTTDSTIAAKINNGDMLLTMDYLYRWKGKDTVEAKAIRFTVNDEAVEHPQEWMQMVRCKEKGRK